MELIIGASGFSGSLPQILGLFAHVISLQEHRHAEHWIVKNL
jgi:hypothetical protein